MNIRVYWYKFLNSFYFKLRNKQLFIKQDILVFLFYICFMFFLKFYNYLDITYNYYVSTNNESEELVNTLPALIGLVGIIKIGILVFTIGILIGGIFMSVIYWFKIFKIYELDIEKKIEFGINDFNISFEFLAFDFISNLLMGFAAIPITASILTNMMKFGIWLLPIEDIFDISMLSTNSFEIISVFLVSFIIHSINLFSLHIIGKKQTKFVFK